MNQHDWWLHLDPSPQPLLAKQWIPVGAPGFAGAKKAEWQQLLDSRFGSDGWRISHYVRGRIVAKREALREYEQSYRLYLQQRPTLVDFLTTYCGNVYDDAVRNVFDDDYEQPHTPANHYQDIAIRRVIAELIDDPTWPQVVDTPAEATDLTNLNDGQIHRLPRARGFRGAYLLQVRDADSPGFLLNPAVVSVHDPSLLAAHPQQDGWFLHEGCQHLSVEAFWQGSKVIEARYDRFLALGAARTAPLAGLGA